MILHFRNILNTIVTVVFCTCAAMGQQPTKQTLSKDLDFDSIADQIIYDPGEGVITCKLSTQGFKPITSPAFGDLEPEQSKVSLTASGFQLSYGFMRWGYGWSFRYDKVAKKIRLIGMNRYDFGNAANDGSGKSSVNMLTNKYEGYWHYYDHKQGKLVAIPVIRKDMIFPKTFLNDSADGVFQKYLDLCGSYIADKKQEMLAAKTKKN